MPLILVIESDRRQTSKLAILARNQLHADLLIVDNVHQALAKLDECDPDLILTSPQMSGRDQLSLGDRLLQLEEHGLLIQTVTMPTLGVAGQRARMAQKGAPGRTPVPRGRPSQSDVVDPVVFGMQINTQLDRIASERAASGHVARRAQPVAISTVEEEPEVLEETPVVEAPQAADAPRASHRPDWGELLDEMRREIEVAQSSSWPQPDRAEDSAEVAARPSQSEDVPQAIKPDLAEPVSPPAAASATPGRKTKKVRRVPPQDEFGFFDPRQCGLSALFAKLDTISPPPGKAPPKKPS